ncbi:hypothetical protein GT347_02390 [Xylophilus rhododendri]|uniref:DUF4148 domain-containing protein n=1 Tax=Xylophilus rhododendri TaxID=2697032 RepID=A0A857J031_9BURK|nr:hypothetical protein [Xylophilus rhododendri]QHI96937.1 hypothetical protein GT347_02390 [Xylophilus rhododendri]
MKTSRTLALFSAALTLAFAGSAFAQEADSAAVATAAPAGPSLSRAEVEADRNLWLQSGLSTYAGNQSAEAGVPGYARAMTRYRAARSGPAWFAELRRVQGQDGAAMASGPASANKAE